MRHYEFRQENPLYYDGSCWLRHLNDNVKTNDLAIAAARRYGMEIYVVDGVFEHGAQGDAGACSMFPYAFEDRLRREHPEYIPVDRWGERVAPGPVEFCYPEVRRSLVDRFVYHVDHYGYDGIAFYTYIENMGLRYPEEFGFNEPVVQEFKRRYGVDIRTEPFDKEAWARLRGEYVTEFLRELHNTLATKGKKLGMALRGDWPHLAGEWIPDVGLLPGLGMVHLDWETWVKEGILDGVIGWYWKPDQNKNLPGLLAICKGAGIELVVRADFLEGQPKMLVDAGVTFMRHIWYPHLDRFALEKGDLAALKGPDWRLRCQTLLEIAAGTLKADGKTVADLSHDPHVLVRREAIRALAALKAADQVAVIEDALGDRESAVRIAAANALSKVNSPRSPQRLLEALHKDSFFQMKEACVVALQAMPERAEPLLIESLRNASEPVREACVRVLEKSSSAESLAALLSSLQNDEDYRVRFWAVRALSVRNPSEVVRGLLAALNDPTPTVQIGAARALGDMALAMSVELAGETLASLEKLFRQYGDGCTRTDAAWGWRVVGNAIGAFVPAGNKLLESMRAQKQDGWLAWAAYLVIHVPQVADKAIMCEEKDAVETHTRYAPRFPGHRQ
jgi:HEAT repeat protein